ncbi:MAG TPA: hemolysin III family protein, partial [Anaerolineales bacterium]
VGIVIKLMIVRAPRWVNAGIAVIMGWIAVFAFRQLVLLPIPVFAWLIVGGVIYTLGAIVYVTKLFNFVPGRFGFHEVWHIFVMLGAAAHFMAVLQL